MATMDPHQMASDGDQFEVDAHQADDGFGTVVLAIESDRRSAACTATTACCSSSRIGCF